MAVTGEAPAATPPTDAYPSMIVAPKMVLPPAAPLPPPPGRREEEDDAVAAPDGAARGAAAGRVAAVVPSRLGSTSTHEFWNPNREHRSQGNVPLHFRLADAQRWHARATCSRFLRAAAVSAIARAPGSRQGRVGPRAELEDVK